MKINLIKDWEKYIKDFLCADGAEINTASFLRKKQAEINEQIDREMLSKQMVAREDYIKRPYLKTDLQWECPQCSRKYASVLIINGMCRHCYEASCNNSG